MDRQEPIEVFIGDKRFALSHYRDFFGRTNDKNDDQAIVNAALLTGDTIRVRSLSRAMEVANDYYDFKGLDKALAFVKNRK